MDRFGELLSKIPGIGKKTEAPTPTQPAGVITPESAKANFEAWSKVAPDPKDKVIRAQNEANIGGEISNNVNTTTSFEDKPLTLPQKGEQGYVPPTSESPLESTPTQIPIATEATPIAQEATQPATEEPKAA